MANLIIRPASGAGNKVVVQDQAGAAVLTTADSGATVANATLNSPTLVTPALGTPASGVLTNATFPAGHVLQTKIGSNTAASTGTHVAHTSSASSWTTIVSATITPSAATSKILIYFTANLSGDAGSFALHILRGSEEVGQADAASNRVRAYTTSGAIITQGGSIYDMHDYSGVFLDDISDGTAWTSGAINYYLKLSFYAGSGTYRINRTQDHRNNAAGYDGVSASHIVLQEIA